MRRHQPGASFFVNGTGSVRMSIGVADTSKARRRCLVMTGGTSGIGRRTLEQLLREFANWSVVLLARPSPRVAELAGLPGAAERLTIVDADLASLRSVDRACNVIARRIGSDWIDALALNAGMQSVRGDRASA